MSCRILNFEEEMWTYHMVLFYPFFFLWRAFALNKSKRIKCGIRMQFQLYSFLMVLLRR